MSRFDFSHPPFDSLTASEQQSLEACADIAFFADDDEIMGPGKPVDTLWVVIKGIVREMAGEEVIGVYRERDTFDARALIAGETHNRFVVHEEALLYAIPRAQLMELTGRNLRFGAYFYASVSHKLAALSERPGHRELQTLLTARVRDVRLREPVKVDGSTTLQQAAETMKAQRVKSLLVQDGARLGIYTTTDFRDVIINGTPYHTPLRELGQFQLMSVDIDDFLFNALLTMTRNNIRRLVVTSAGQAVGILSQVDVLSYFSNHSHLIAQRIERAQNLDELADAAGQITRLVRILSGHGVKPPQLARLVQTLNARLFERAWQMLAPPALQENSCLIVMGSEGRGEQILKTDQDNALIIRDGFPQDGVAEICDAFSGALARFGYPPCAGGIMLSNPAWRLNQSEMQARIQQWTFQPDSTSLMNLAIFVDAEAVAGDAGLLREAHEVLQQAIADDAAFYARFARAIEQFDTPLGLFAQLLTREADGEAVLDLKKGGIFPIVHGTRALALEAGIHETNTLERLAALTSKGLLEQELSHDLAEALTFLIGIKLGSGLDALEEGRQPDNLIAPYRLSTLERDLLKDAFAVVKRYKSMLRHHFKLGSF
ncbi:cyclic nucleotide-binding/CBS domain-containing protein [Rhodobacteraceae bacterium CH30]|nr:cyclic nucleotide-binding/CBS domain-containing protein [Rhodobacteraceae bacterium CH30]